MWSYKSSFKKNWDMFIVFLAIYNSLMIPFDQAFKPPFLSYIGFIIFDNIVDLLFVFDVILMFFTSVLTDSGSESYDSEDVSKMYMSAVRFKVDIISLLGSDVLSGIHRYFSLFGMFKLLRVFRLS